MKCRKCPLAMLCMVTKKKFYPKMEKKVLIVYCVSCRRFLAVMRDAGGNAEVPIRDNIIAKCRELPPSFKARCCECSGI